MCRFVIPVQAATIFSLCLAWDLPLDKLIPESDYKLSYEDNKNIHTPAKTENKLELAENFTQFLQRKNNKRPNVKSVKPKDPYSVNVWSRLRENYNNKKTTLTDTYTDLRDISSTKKRDYAEFKNDMLIISTKKLEESTTNDIDPHVNLLKTDIFNTEDENEDSQVMDLPEDDNLDYKQTILKKIGPIKDNLELVTNNLLNENSAFGIDSNDDVFNLQKIYKIDPPEELPILKNIVASRNSTMTTTQSFILQELQKKIELSEANNTPKNVVNSDIILHDTRPVCDELKDTDNERINSFDRKLHSNIKKDTSVEMDDKQTINFVEILNRENQILDILKRQTQLLEHLAKYIDAKEQEKEAMRSVASFKDLDDLLDEVDKKRKMLGKGTNMTQKALETVKKKSKLWKQQTMNNNKQTTAPTTQQRMLPTVKTVIDETEVRNALRKDPFVQRILKIARRKRLQYLEEALT